MQYLHASSAALPQKGAVEVAYDIHAENRVFRELFENSPHPLWAFDIETLHLLAVNDAAIAKYGYSREEFLGMSATDLRPSEEVPRFLSHLKNQDNNVDKAGRWVHRKKDGSLLHVDITAQKITFNGRDAEMVLAIDVTSQVNAIHRLEEAERKYRSLVEQSLVGIYVLKDMRISYANPHLASMFGYTTGEFSNIPFLDLAVDSDKPRLQQTIQRRLTGEAIAGHSTFHGLRKDGSEIIVDIHGTKVTDKDGAALTGIVLDVTQATLAEHRAQEHVTQLERMLQTTIGAITTMGDIRDSYTAGHERRVGDLSAAIGAEMGLESEAQKWLRITGMVHDSGKIGIPSDILSKPKRLTLQEYELVKVHPQLGFEILKTIEFPRAVAQIVLQHHERLDGSGYPSALRGVDILPEANIVAVADVVESMASHRPYRPALGIGVALDEISTKAGTLYDTDTVEACLRLFQKKGYSFEHAM
jgi:PAS domain S-box-containing protein